MSEGNVKTISALYEAMNERDVGRAHDLVHPDVEWISDPRLGIGPLMGREAVIGFFQGQAEVFDELSIEVDRVSGVGDKVLAFICVTGVGRASRVRTDIRIAHLWTLRDGVVIVGEGYGSRDEALRAAGLNE